MFKIMNIEISPAKLQGHLLRFKKSLVDALKEFTKLEESTEELPAAPASHDSGCTISDDKLTNALTKIENRNEPNQIDNNE